MVKVASIPATGQVAPFAALVDAVDATLAVLVGPEGVVVVVRT